MIFSKRREIIRKQKVIRQLPNDINERFESASLGGTARPVFPTGLARPNAASGWRDSACQDCLKEGRISPSLKARIAEALSKTCLFRAEETDGPVRGTASARGGARDRLRFAKAEATERREARRNSWRRERQ